MLFWAATASAHFKLNLNVRILHVEHLSDGMNVYMRLPMPYLVAHLLGEAEEGELPSPAPYTSNRFEEGKLVHYVDAAQLRDSTDDLRESWESIGDREATLTLNVRENNDKSIITGTNGKSLGAQSISIFLHPLAEFDFLSHGRLLSIAD